MHRTENHNSAMGKDTRSSPTKDIDTSSCSSQQISPSKPAHGRYCHIVKRPNFDGYGFNLHSEKVKPGQYIGKVDPNSPAEAAGLREGDQIIEVNGVIIGIETHKQVVQRIKAISNEVRLLLIDSNTDDVNFNTKTQTDVIEKNTVNNQYSTNAIANFKSSSPTDQPKSRPIMLPTEINIPGTVTPSADQKEYITCLSMVTAQSSSNYIDKTTATNIDFVSNPTNGHQAKLNEQSLESTTTGIIAEQSELTQQEPQQKPNSSQNNTTNNKIGLNLNLTAAEMRAKLLAKKKFDPKNDSVDLKKKFDIIQKL